MAIILTGSFALGAANSRSDIDLMIVAKHGRIYTVRLFANFLAIVFRQKRARNPNIDHSGKFCLNYFIADNYLQIPTGRGHEIDAYCAKNYGRSILLFELGPVFQQFLAKNRALFEKTEMKRNQELLTYFPIQKTPSTILCTIIRSFFEFVLSGSIGNLLERRTAKTQIRSIESDPITKKWPKYIVYNECELRFHPPK